MNFIVFESGEELEKAARNPRWLAQISHCFYPKRVMPDIPQIPVELPKLEHK